MILADGTLVARSVAKPETTSSVSVSMYWSAWAATGASGCGSDVGCAMALAPHSRSPSRFDASTRSSSMTCWYRWTMRRSDQPMTAMTVCSSMPCSSSMVAAVCRPSCTRASRTQASRQIAFHSSQSFFASMGRPSGRHQTNPKSSQASPAWRRSRSCVCLWAASRLSIRGSREIRRLPASLFGSMKTIPPPVRCGQRCPCLVQPGLHRSVHDSLRRCRAQSSRG